MAIVVGGEALSIWCRTQAGELRAHAGGGPYNTARTLGRLEQDVHYLGCLSDDGFGARLRARLVEDGVALDTVVETPRPTTLALAELDERGAATYRFYTEGTSAPALEPEQALAVLPDHVDFLHVGTLGLVMEPTALALQAVVEAVAERALIMVDPNCRPTFIEDRDTYRRGLAATLRTRTWSRSPATTSSTSSPARTWSTARARCSRTARASRWSRSAATAR